mmetsp:Transcript_36590/g.113203  ORF Transcript_36590/g.113203 Transcript_36590/m.113203 type:complete len:251 (+) Transcript_36590:115-867(+)
MADPSEGALEQFCVLAKSAGGGRAVVGIVQQALNAKKVFFFGELLAMPTVSALKGTEHAPHLDLLEIFAYGTYADYKAKQSALPALTPPQRTKLRQLSLASLARDRAVVPYSQISDALDVPAVRDLEDLVIEAVYAGLVAGKMDQMRKEFRVAKAAGRDVRPENVAKMAGRLDAWAARADQLSEQLDLNKAAAKASREGRATDAAALQAKVDAVKASLSRDDANLDDMDLDADRPKRRAKRSRAPFKSSA